MVDFAEKRKHADTHWWGTRSAYTVGTTKTTPSTPVSGVKGGRKSAMIWRLLWDRYRLTTLLASCSRAGKIGRRSLASSGMSCGRRSRTYWTGRAERAAESHTPGGHGAPLTVHKAFLPSSKKKKKNYKIIYFFFLIVNFWCASRTKLI